MKKVLPLFIIVFLLYLAIDPVFAHGLIYKKYNFLTGNIARGIYSIISLVISLYIVSRYEKNIYSGDFNFIKPLSVFKLAVMNFISAVLSLILSIPIALGITKYIAFGLRQVDIRLGSDSIIFFSCFFSCVLIFLIFYIVQRIKVKYIKNNSKNLEDNKQLGRIVLGTMLSTHMRFYIIIFLIFFPAFSLLIHLIEYFT